MFKILICLLWIPGLVLAQVPNRFISVLKAAPVISAGADLYLPPGQTFVQPQVVSDDPGPGQTYSYLWSGPSSYTSSLKQPDLSIVGNYILQVTNSTGCSSQDIMNLRIVAPTDTIMYPVLPMCQGIDTILLDKYISYPGEGSFSGTNVINRSFVPSSAGTFTVTWRMGTKTYSTSIIVRGIPSVKVFRDTIIRCMGDSTWISALGTTDTYHWSLSSDPSTILSTQKDYRVKVSDSLKAYLLKAGITYISDNLTCYTQDTIAVVPAPTKADFTYVADHNRVNFTGIPGALTYSWSFGDGATSTLANPIHTYMRNGYATVNLSITSMCASRAIYKVTKDILIVDLVYTGISGVVSKNIKIYPNPAIDYVTFEGIESFDILQVFDLNGRMITTVKVQSDIQQLDVASYKAGVYLLKFADKDGGVFTSRLIKK